MNPRTLAWALSTSILLWAGAGLAEDEKQALALCLQGIAGELRANVVAHLQIIQAGQETKDASITAWLTDTLKDVANGREPPSCYELRISESRLRWLHSKAEEDIRIALQPFGFYRPSIESSLEHSQKGWIASYRIELGEPVRIAKLDLRVLGEGGKDPKLREILTDSPLKPGDILDQPAYDELKKKLQRTATDRGYFDAGLKTHEIRIDLQRNTADVILWFDTGPRYRFGEVNFAQTALAPSFLQRYVRFEAGDPYESKSLLDLQSDLINSDYFSEVEVQAPHEKAVDHEIPVEVGLDMRQRRQLSTGLGYATDTGPRGRLGWEYRWLNPQGHRFNTELRASAIKQGIAAAYEIPGARPATDQYRLNARLSRENSDVKDTQTAVVGVMWRKHAGPWQRLLTLDYGVERFRAEQTQTAKLLLPGINLIRIAGDDPLVPTRGSRLDLNLIGSYETPISDLSLLQPKLSGKLIWSFGTRNRIIARSDLGTTWVSDFNKLPTSLRFFAGGDQSVRGYALDKISPVDDKGDEVGGKHLVVGSLEYEHRLFEKWGVAAFVDSGDAFDKGLDLKTGVGVGARWYSPVGPIRVDIGHGLDSPPGDDIRLHIVIGPDL